MAKLVHRACRVVSGVSQTFESLQAQISSLQSQSANASGQPPAPSTQERKVKLSAILSQVDDEEAPLITEKELVAAYLRYSAIFGNDERPSKDSEPTLEQLSAVRRLVRQSSVPYVDFRVWGPFGHRLVKKIKLSGCIIGRDGRLTTTELTGPSNFGMWLQSWQVFSNVCIMLNIIDLGTLTKYKDLI